MIDILHEWATMPIDCEAWRNLDKLGVSWEAFERCGGPLPVRVRTDGGFFEPSDPDGQIMLVQPVYGGPIPSIADPVDEPCLLDLIAYSPRHPDRWHWRRGESGLILGDAVLDRAAYFGEPVNVYRNPWAWLRAGGDGVCLLDRHPNAIERLREVQSITTEDTRHGREVERLLRTTRPAMPAIYVSQGAVA